MRSLLALIPCAALTFAAEPPKVPLKITPGKAIVPTDAMRRIWGELISVDLKTRTGTFRNEGNDEIMSFTVLPYAELLHHAAFGDLQDYRVGERAIFRLHQNDEGKWVWLTYIQDEMNFLNGHKEFYWVDSLDAKGRIEFTQANADKSFVRTKGLVLQTDAQTRYWKDGKPAQFSDIKVGDKLRTKTHGTGKGAIRVCWEVFLDEASLLKFQAEQQAVQRKRMAEEGLPGYVDEVDGDTVKLTLFQEARETAAKLKVNGKVQLATAGVDRKAGTAVDGVVTEVKPVGNLTRVTIRLSGKLVEGLRSTALARLMDVKRE